jgi:hypothetical protein
VRTEDGPGEVWETLERGRCNGESEVRQMEVADDSTLHCTGVMRGGRAARRWR